MKRINTTTIEFTADEVKQIVYDHMATLVGHAVQCSYFPDIDKVRFVHDRDGLVMTFDHEDAWND